MFPFLHFNSYFPVFCSIVIILSLLSFSSSLLAISTASCCSSLFPIFSSVFFFNFYSPSTSVVLFTSSLLHLFFFFCPPPSILRVFFCLTSSLNYLHTSSLAGKTRGNFSLPHKDSDLETKTGYVGQFFEAGI